MLKSLTSYDLLNNIWKPRLLDCNKSERGLLDFYHTFVSLKNSRRIEKIHVYKIHSSIDQVLHKPQRLYGNFIYYFRRRPLILSLSSKRRKYPCRKNAGECFSPHSIETIHFQHLFFYNSFFYTQTVLLESWKLKTWCARVDFCFTTTATVYIIF